MSVEEIMERFAKVTATLERMFKMVLYIIGLTASGVLWGARLEWKIRDVTEKQLSQEVAINKLVDIANALKIDEAIMKQRMDSQKGNTSQNVDVKVGAMAADTPSESHRDHLTTEELAKLERVTTHTITNWVAEGRIKPEPVKRGKSFAFDPHYAVLPEKSGKFPQISENSSDEEAPKP